MWLLGNLKLIGALAGLLAVAGVAGWLYWHGGKDKQDAIDRQNVEAAGKANQADLDRAECRRLGGVFDFVAGECARPQPDGG